MDQRSKAFQAEVRLEPGRVLLAFALVGFVFFALSQLLEVSTQISEAASWMAVGAMGVAFIGVAYAAERPQVARWFTAASSVLLLLVATWGFGEPSILALAGLPILLAGHLLGWFAALGMALVQTLVMVAMMVWGSGEVFGTGAVVSLVGIWLTVALVWYEQRRLRKLVDWISWHYERSESHLGEARREREQAARATSSLVQANRQLALANERTAVLRRAAEDAHQAKAIFVANVSHEFRTPLNMIIGLVQIMVESPQIYASIISPKMRRDLETVYRNCVHLASMVDDVLDLTRTEAGRVTLHQEPVDLTDVVRQAADTVRPLLEEKELSFGFVVSDDLPHVYCDRTRIQQVILNLLSNAARFTDKGGIEVGACCDDGTVVVRVSDTGPGIAPEQRERVFEPFWQSEAPVQARRGGTGLGLSISREFVQLHGGRMWVDSELGQGTTFHFSLPISPPVAPRGRPGHSIRDDWVWREEGFRLAADAMSDDLLRSRVVLYDPMQSLSTMVLRESDQLEIVKAKTKEDICQAVDALASQLLVVNAASKQDLLEEMASVGDLVPDVPMVGYVMAPDVDRGLEAYIQGYLVKPVMREDLVEAIQSTGRPVRRVLLVDDDPEVVELLTLQLASYDADLKMDCAVCGSQALELLASERYDLVFLDVVMPDLDGWQVLARATRDNLLRGASVYIVSAQDPVDQEMASELVMVADGQGGVAASEVVTCALRLVQALRSR